MAKLFNIGVLLQGKDKSKPVTDGIGKITKSAKKAEGGIGNLSKSFWSLGTALKAFVLGATVKKAVDYLSSYAAGADEIAKFSRQVNLSTEALQEWRYASEIAGIGGQNFDRAAQQLTRRLGEMKGKVGETYTFIRKISPDLWKQFTGAEGTDEAMQIAVRALEKIKDPAKRALLASKLFGEELGGKMTRFAAMGSKALAETRKEAEKFGLVSEDAAKEAEAWDDDIFRLKAAFGGLKTAIGSELLPVLRPMVQEFTNWVKDNKGEVAKKISDAIKGIAEWLRGIDWKAVGKGIGSFLTTVGKVVDSLGGVKGLIIGIGAMKLGGLILEVSRLGGALSGIATGPIALIIAGLGAVALGISDAIDRIDEADRRLREQRRWRKGMHDEADRKTGEAFERAGVPRLKPGEERKTLLQPGEGPRVPTGSQLGRLFGDLAFSNALHGYAGGKLSATDVQRVDREYEEFRKARPSLTGGTDHLSAFNNLLQDARDAGLGFGQSVAPVEVNLNVSVPSGTDVEVQTKGKGKVTTKERRTGRRRIGR